MPSFTNTELVSGTSGVRLLKNAEPDQVANAMVRAIARRAGGQAPPKSCADRRDRCLSFP